jgi:hypothetical protein
MEIRDPEAGAEGVPNFCKVLILGLYTVLKLSVSFFSCDSQWVPNGYPLSVMGKKYEDIRNTESPPPFS